nr:pilus assembly protein N-terminal domain-containing protein [Bradyrhizobium cajani]
MSFSGFWHCRVFAALALLTGVANAQPPQEVIATDTIELRAQQARTFSFDQPVNKVTLSTDGVAQVTPETDRTLTIKGMAPGRTLMTAYAPDGKIIHRSNIKVEQTEGYVKIYGGRGPDGKRSADFTGYYCTTFGCGRADPDVPPVPFSTIISETQNKGDGNSVTTSREYR